MTGPRRSLFNLRDWRAVVRAGIKAGENMGHDDGIMLTSICHPNTSISEGVHEFNHVGDQACIHCGALFEDIWRGNGRWTYKCEKASLP